MNHRLRRAAATTMTLARIGAGCLAVVRLSRVARAAPPVRPTITPMSSISVVVPARDEAERIGPLLDAIVGAPGVAEVIVVDDQSSDRTGDVAEVAGARVIIGRPLPNGWAGKAWALQQGVEAAKSEWVVTLDADTLPDPDLPSALVARVTGDRIDLLTVGGRFDCPTPASRWLHAAMLTSLVYRFGPPGSSPPRPDRTVANGQCMVFHRAAFLERGGMALVAGHVVEDVALARRLASEGWRVAFLDAGEMLSVRMYESFGDTWRGWGRSLCLPGVETRNRQLFDLTVLFLAQVAPIPRLLARRGDALDVALGLVRLGTLVGTRRAYTRVDLAYWLSPLADPLAALALAGGIARRGRQTWRGRSYGSAA